MSDRLTKEKWVLHGLKTLEAEGFGALKAEPMAKALKVSRGSFYWHFKDIVVFQQDVLALWRERTTLQVIESLEGSGNTRARLMGLMNIAFRGNRDLERAVRAWAIQDPQVAEVVAAVDSERIGFIVGLLGAGLRSRATFLYWAYLGQAMTEMGGALRFGDAEIEEIVDLFHGVSG